MVPLQMHLLLLHSLFQADTEHKMLSNLYNKKKNKIYIETEVERTMYFLLPYIFFSDYKLKSFLVFLYSLIKLNEILLAHSYNFR